MIIFENQYLNQVVLLLIALFLSALIGLERQIQGKSAGLRTQAIVGMTAALMMIISKYGFMDVLAEGVIRLDPSRVAAQIVSGIGFLGAGIIMTRHGAIHGLTTAATIWETAAIGMACGAGMWWLGLAGTCFHFIVVWVVAPLVNMCIRSRVSPEATLRVAYPQGKGTLRVVLSKVTKAGWSVNAIQSSISEKDDDVIAHISVKAHKRKQPSELIAALSETPNVHAVRLIEDFLD